MKISVCIPTYNQAHYLEQAINSAVNQTIAPFEIIVSNDCSTDSTAEVLLKLSKTIPNLKVVNQSKNLGIAKNTDACLRLAMGDYIVRLDSDDCLSEKYIEKLFTLLTKYPTAGYAHAAVQEVDQHGKFLQQRKLVRKGIFLSDLDALKASVKGYRVAANIIMFKRQALLKVNYLQDRPDYVEDYHVTTAIAAAGYGNIYLDEILSFYRVWLDTGKVRQRRKLLEIVGLRRVFDELIEPAFNKKEWDTKELEQSRIKFACRQADCLSWKVYNKEEKKELASELLRLSSASKARFCIQMYLSPFGRILDTKNKMFNNIRKTAKSIALQFILK